MQSLLLKLSGEALGGDSGIGVDPVVLERVSGEIGDLLAGGTRLAVVLGGGNLFRGARLAQAGMDRVVGDRMGMLATVMNGLALGDFLTRSGIANTVFSAAAVAGVVRGYDRDAAAEAMAAGHVAILTGGTGNPLFTTDTAACLRGIELGVTAVAKATNVDGVFNADPNKDPNAQKFDTISYDEVLRRELGVMDLTAIVLCKENAMPLIVFDVNRPGALVALGNGGTVGTRVTA